MDRFENRFDCLVYLILDFWTDHTAGWLMRQALLDLHDMINDHLSKGTIFVRIRDLAIIQVMRYLRIKLDALVTYSVIGAYPGEDVQEKIRQVCGNSLYLSI